MKVIAKAFDASAEQELRDALGPLYTFMLGCKLASGHYELHLSRRIHHIVLRGLQSEDPNLPQTPFKARKGKKAAQHVTVVPGEEGEPERAVAYGSFSRISYNGRVGVPIDFFSHPPRHGVVRFNFYPPARPDEEPVAGSEASVDDLAKVSVASGIGHAWHGVYVGLRGVEPTHGQSRCRTSPCCERLAVVVALCSQVRASAVVCTSASFQGPHGRRGTGGDGSDAEDHGGQGKRRSSP